MQAVEQLGVDKAVPSRILEIMGIDCLTRHNIASHLQVHMNFKHIGEKGKEIDTSLIYLVIFSDLNFQLTLFKKTEIDISLID